MVFIGLWIRIFFAVRPNLSTDVDNFHGCEGLIKKKITHKRRSTQIFCGCEKKSAATVMKKEIERTKSCR